MTHSKALQIAETYINSKHTLDGLYNYDDDYITALVCDSKGNEKTLIIDLINEESHYEFN